MHTLACSRAIEFGWSFSISLNDLWTRPTTAVMKCRVLISCINCLFNPKASLCAGALPVQLGLNSDHTSARTPELKSDLFSKHSTLFIEADAQLKCKHHVDGLCPTLLGVQLTGIKFIRLLLLLCDSLATKSSCELEGPLETYLAQV